MIYTPLTSTVRLIASTDTLSPLLIAGKFIRQMTLKGHNKLHHPKVGVKKIRVTTLKIMALESL